MPVLRQSWRYGASFALNSHRSAAAGLFCSWRSTVQSAFSPKRCLIPQPLGHGSQQKRHHTSGIAAKTAPYLRDRSKNGTIPPGMSLVCDLAPLSPSPPATCRLAPCRLTPDACRLAPLSPSPPATCRLAPCRLSPDACLLGLFQSPPSRGMGCDEEVVHDILNDLLRFQSPPSRGMGCDWAVCMYLLPSLPPYVSIPSFAGHGLRLPPEIACKMIVALFQSPPSRGMGCDTVNMEGEGLKQSLSFNPLLRGAWAATPAPQTCDLGRNRSVSIPSFAGHGLRPSSHGRRPQQQSLVSIPSFAGHGLRLFSFLREARARRFAVSIPSFAGHGLRLDTTEGRMAQALGKFQSPPSRGMGCDPRPLAPTASRVRTTSFNPLLRGAWAATSRTAHKMRALLAGPFQSPPSRGMGCDHHHTPPFRSPPCAVSIPSFAGHGLRLAGEIMDAFALVLMFQSPPSRGMGCDHHDDTETSRTPSWFQSPPSRGMGCDAVVRSASGSRDLRVSIPSFAGHGLRQVRIAYGCKGGSLPFQSPPSRGMGCDSLLVRISEETHRFQSPPSRGMGCDSPRIWSRSSTSSGQFQSPPSRGMGCDSDKTVEKLFSKLISFNPLLRGAWAATKQPKEKENGIHHRFQSPPSRGMGCDLGAAAVAQAQADQFQSPPSRGMGCDSSLPAPTKGARHPTFQSPPSRGMGCDKGDVP